MVDTGGNTWTITPDVSANAGTTVAVAVLRARITTALDTGDTITVTISGDARGRWAMQADAFDDLDASPLDKTASNTPGSSASLSSGVTAATAQATELVYALFGFGANRTPTIPGGWTGGTKVETSAGSGDRGLQVIHKYVTSVGTQEGTLTLSSGSTYAGAIATYTYTPTDPPVAQVSQLKLTVPQAGEARVARVAQLKFTVPRGVLGTVQVSQLKLRVPTAAGQAPYTGLKAMVDGKLRNAEIWAAG
ncbi:MAG TPA: hypothetical protein VHA75_08200 [Rugosimonospora sp.]|nr:hypothetical protein [Rugosimonospora sp.]